MNVCSLSSAIGTYFYPNLNYIGERERLLTREVCTSVERSERVQLTAVPWNFPPLVARHASRQVDRRAHREFTSNEKEDLWGAERGKGCLLIPGAFWLQ